MSLQIGEVEVEELDHHRRDRTDHEILVNVDARESPFRQCRRAHPFRPAEDRPILGERLETVVEGLRAAASSIEPGCRRAAGWCGDSGRCIARKSSPILGAGRRARKPGRVGDTADRGRDPVQQKNTSRRSSVPTRAPEAPDRRIAAASRAGTPPRVASGRGPYVRTRGRCGPSLWQRPELRRSSPDPSACSISIIARA